MRGVATGGSRFGSGAHDGERVERPAARRMAGGGVAAPKRAWDACARGEVPRGGPGGAEGFPRVHLAAGARWTKSTGGVRRAARNRATGGERDEGEGLSVISEKIQGPIGKLKISPVLRAQTKKC